MEPWLIFVAIGVFVGGVAVYGLFMIFLPEWVGITGKTALEAERSHREGAEPDNSLENFANGGPPLPRSAKTAGVDTSENKKGDQ